jgi:hypothetical protein
LSLQEIGTSKENVFARGESRAERCSRKGGAKKSLFQMKKQTRLIFAIPAVRLDAATPALYFLGPGTQKRVAARWRERVADVKNFLIQDSARTQ